MIDEKRGRAYSIDGSYLAKLADWSGPPSSTGVDFAFTKDERWDGDPATVIPLTEIPPIKQRGRYVFAAPEDEPTLKISAAEYAALIEIARKHTCASCRTSKLKSAAA